MYKELKDYFPEGIIGNGIFTAISNITWFPGVNPTEIDIYFIMHEGDRLGSKYLENFANDEGIVEGEKLQTLAKILHNAFIKNWQHEYKALTVEYDPISNNDYVEIYKGSAKGNSGGSTTQSGNVVNEQDTAGLGSSTYANDKKSTTTYNAVKNTVSSNSEGEDEHTIHRKGLIGNIKTPTISDMLEDDIDTWSKHKFYDLLCKDICDTIALSIYL